MRDGLLVCRFAFPLPQDIALADLRVQRTRDHKQKIGEPVQILDCGCRYRFRPGQAHHAPFRPAAHCTGQMTHRRTRRAAGQDELLERHQAGIELIECMLERGYPVRAHGRMAWNAKFASEVEQRVLNVR